MAHCTVSVSEPSKRKLLPSWASEFAILLEVLQRRGVLTAIAERLRIPRTGFAGIDAVVFLLGMFSAGQSASLSAFAARSCGYGQRLAALAGRARWPGQSSVSRLLTSVGRTRGLGAFGDWLLMQGGEMASLVGHPLAMQRDATGAAVAVFDFDPTVIAVRQRALPDSPELPEPQRHSERLCAPGYSGRKRGETQVSLTPLQSAGTGLWLHCGVQPGNAHFARCCEAAMAALMGWLQAAKLQPDSAVVRVDGAGGTSSTLTIIAALSVKFVARLARYGLLEQLDVQQLLKTADWTAVPDSGSGPKRWATELGSVLLDAADGGEQQASSLRARVVLTRFARDDKHGAGVVIDGWQYEMFGTNLDAAAWPAAALVALYCGRASIENRFAQQGRQLHLGTVWCFEPAGQLLATLVSLWLANLRIVLGASLGGELGAPQPQPQASAVHEPADAGPEPADAGPEPPDVVPEAHSHLAERESATVAPPHLVQPSPERAIDEQIPADVDPLLSKLPPQLLAQSLGRKPGWSLLNGELRCPQAYHARFHRLHAVKRHWYAHYKVGSLHCGPCPQRSQCTTTSNLGYEPSMCLPLGQLIADGHDIHQLARDAASHRKALPTVDGPRRPTAHIEQPKWLPPATTRIEAPRPTMPAELLPTRLRERWLSAVVDCMALVHIRPATATTATQTSPWTAPTDAIRQRRRLTWAERLQRHALDGDVSLRLIAASNAAAAWLERVMQVEVIA